MNSPSGPMADAELELADAVKQFEGLFVEVVEGLPQRLSQTGEEYTELYCWGPRREGECAKVEDFITGKMVPGLTIHSFAGNAISDWSDEVLKFASPMLAENPTLYWRIRPEIDYGHVDIHAANGLFRVPSWKVYSRLLISNKPRIS